MTVEERFEKAAVFLEILAENKKTGELNFKDSDGKLSFQNVYQSIYGRVEINFNCATCVRFCLEQLDAWYQREWPKHLATTVVKVEADVQDEKKLVEAESVKVDAPKPKRKVQRR